MPQIEINNLPEGANQELPSGDQKMKSSRGTLAGWVIRTCFALVLIVSWIAYRSVVSENVDLKQALRDQSISFSQKLDMKDKKIEELNNTIANLLIQQIAYLKPTKQKVEKVENKVDSLKKFR